MSGFEKSVTPLSVAIIMDGNGRWASLRSLPRSEGHVFGARVVSPVLKTLFHHSVRYVTLYAFSTENWRRPKEEVDGIMALIYRYLREVAIPEILSNEKVGLRFIGDLSPLSENLRSACDYAQSVSGDREYICSVALNYGGRSEIVHAVNRAVSAGNSSINENILEQYLYTAGIPDPDLIIRTGGEMRISNFLLWQSAYSEYVILNKLWPDLAPSDITDALGIYAQRHRRYGGL